MTLPYGTGPSNTQTAFLPSEIQFPMDEKLFREILSKRERLTATVLNVKENAQYDLTEIYTGQQWFSTSAINLPSQKRGAYRLTFDLVALNGGVALPAGATTLTLTASTQPAKINIATALLPTNGYGACTNTTNFYFINDPLVFVRTNKWTNATQTITITNNTGSPLTQCYWVFEYIKT